jgi:uncharacterized membrane protein
MTRTWSQRRLAVVAALSASSAFALAILAVRVAYTGSMDYRNLAWNVTLAWIPMVFSVVAYDRSGRGSRTAALAIPALLWLLFLPNAPYLVTDYSLLREHDGAPVWFDVLLLTAFAWSGLLLGFVSLYLMQSVFRRLFGWLTAWLLTLTAIGLASFGVFLGRFLRWNSWDVFVEPRALLADIWQRAADPLAHQDALAATVAFAGFMTLAYLGLYAFLHAALGDREERA